LSGLAPEARAQAEAVIAAHTNADGSRKPTWLRAPDGSQTLLTPRQWVLVRTPNFKRWFGDWEALTELSLPADVTTTLAEAESALAQLAGQDLTNLETGIVARINRPQSTKILSNAAVGKSTANGFTVTQHNAAASIIGNLWKHASLVESRADDSGDVNIASIKRFAAPLRFGDDVAVAWLTAKESVEHGHRVYSVELQEIEMLRGRLSAPAKASDTPHGAFTEEKLNSLLAKVNPESVSKVVSANGEPLVVYHETSKDFDFFSKDKIRHSDPDTPIRGFFFTTDPSGGKGIRGKIIPAFLNIRRIAPRRALERKIREGFSSEGDGNSVKERVQRDYDGAIMSKMVVDENGDYQMVRGDMTEFSFDGSGTMDVVVFAPENIKSATANDGTFGGDDPVILRSAASATGSPSSFSGGVHTATDAGTAAAATDAGSTPSTTALRRMVTLARDDYEALRNRLIASRTDEDRKRYGDASKAAKLRAEQLAAALAQREKEAATARAKTAKPRKSSTDGGSTSTGTRTAAKPTAFDEA
jgi:hypothetical protein